MIQNTLIILLFIYSWIGTGWFFISWLRPEYESYSNKQQIFMKTISGPIVWIVYIIYYIMAPICKTIYGTYNKIFDSLK